MSDTKHVALVVYAGTETHENLGRVVNALMIGNELQDSGHQVRLIFDGAGTEWVPVLEQEDHDMHDLYMRLKPSSQVCEYCAGAFETKESTDDEQLDSTYQGHPSFAALVEAGWQFLTF